MHLSGVAYFGKMSSAHTRVVEDAKVQIMSILLPKAGELRIFLNLTQQMVCNDGGTLG